MRERLEQSSLSVGCVALTLGQGVRSNTTESHSKCSDPQVKSAVMVMPYLFLLIAQISYCLHAL